MVWTWRLRILTRCPGQRGAVPYDVGGEKYLEGRYEEPPSFASGPDFAATQERDLMEAHMAKRWSWLDIPMLPALPPPPATADLYEPAGGEAYVIEMHVPGVKPEEISGQATPESLRVSTNPTQEENSDRKYLQREQEIRPWSRLFEFPMEINTDEVQARLEAGILKIYAPKALASRPKVIRIGEPVQSASS